MPRLAVSHSPVVEICCCWTAPSAMTGMHRASRLSASRLGLMPCMPAHLSSRGRGWTRCAPQPCSSAPRRVGNSSASPPPSSLQVWPPDVLSIDIDLVDGAAAGVAAAYALLPARRLAIVTALDPSVPVGSFSAATRTRPNATQVSGACAVAALMVPWLDTGACAGADGGPAQRLLSSLSLATAAVHPPSTLARDGSLGPDAFDDERARELYSPFTAAGDMTAAEATSAAHGSGPLLTWGAGGLPRARAAAGASRVVVASVALDDPRRVPPEGGLFFNASGSRGGAQGPVSAVVAERATAYEGWLGGSGAWRVLATHISLVRTTTGRGAPILLAVAEAAVAVAAARGPLKSPPDGGRGSGSAVAADVLVVAGQACHSTRLASGPPPPPLPASSFTAAALRLCEGGKEGSAPRVAAVRHAGLLQTLLTGGAAGSLPPLPMLPRPTVCWDLRGSGLHRELSVTVDVLVPPPPLPRGGGAPLAAGSSAASTAPLRCELALVHRLEATQYVDLDEARDAERAGGPALRAFTKFIDVERPASASTQHVIVLAGAVHEETPAPGLLLPSQRGVNVSLEPGGGGGVHVTGVLRQLLHLRYQNAGCGDDEGEGGGGSTDDGTFAWQAAPGDLRFLVQQQLEQHQGGAAAPFPGTPYVSGCYARAHLQLPTVHLRCTGATGGGPALQALSDALRGGRDGGGEVAAWAALPVLNSARPGTAGYISACTPPLAPVPVGRRGDALLVRALTMAATLGGALLLLWAAVAAHGGATGVLRVAEPEPAPRASRPSEESVGDPVPATDVRPGAASSSGTESALPHAVLAASSGGALGEELQRGGMGAGQAEQKRVRLRSSRRTPMAPAGSASPVGGARRRGSSAAGARGSGEAAAARSPKG